MQFTSWSFLGMHVFWWLFWLALLIWAYRWAMSQVTKAGRPEDSREDVKQKKREDSR